MFSSLAGRAMSSREHTHTLGGGRERRQLERSAIVQELKLRAQRMLLLSYATTTTRRLCHALSLSVLLSCCVAMKEYVWESRDNEERRSFVRQCVREGGRERGRVTVAVALLCFVWVLLNVATLFTASALIGYSIYMCVCVWQTMHCACVITAFVCHS